MEYLTPIAFGLILLLIITRPFTVLFHELGHAIPILLLTGKKATIFVGSYGNRKYSFRLAAGKLEIWFRYNPLKWGGGLCIAEAEDISTRNKIIYILGGVIFSILIAGILFYLTIAHDLHGSLKLICAFAFGSTIFDLFVNLIPREKVDSDGKLHRSDGFYLRHIIQWGKFSKRFDAAIEFYKNKQYNQAGELFEALSNHRFQNEDINRLAYCCFVYTKNYKKAYLLLQEFSKRYELNSDDYYNFSYVCSCLNRNEEKLLYIEKSLDLNPDSPYALNAIGYELNTSQQYQQAILYFDRAIAADKDFAYAYNNRGHARIEIGCMEEGLLDINYSLQLNSENSYAYRNLGIYYLKLGQYEKAAQLLLKAKQMDSETDLIDELIAQITDNCQGVRNEKEF